MVITNPDINPLLGVVTNMNKQCLPNNTHHFSHAQVNTSAFHFQIPCPHPKVSFMCRQNGDLSEAVGKLLIG